MDAKCPFGFRELYVSFPQRCCIHADELAAQEITPFRQGCPVAPRALARPGNGQARRTPAPARCGRVRNRLGHWLGHDLRRRQHGDCYLEGCRGPPAALEQPTQTTVGYGGVVQPTTGSCGSQFLQTGFQSLQEALMHGLLFLAAIDATCENENLTAIRAWHQLDFHALLHTLPVVFAELTFELTQH